MNIFLAFIYQVDLDWNAINGTNECPQQATTVQTVWLHFPFSVHHLTGLSSDAPWEELRRSIYAHHIMFCSLSQASRTTEATQKTCKHLVDVLICLQPAAVNHLSHVKHFLLLNVHIFCDVLKEKTQTWLSFWWTWHVFACFSWTQAVHVWAVHSAAAGVVSRCCLSLSPRWQTEHVGFGCCSCSVSLTACGNKCSGHTTSCGLAPSHSTTLHSYSSILISSSPWKTLLWENNTWT